MNRRKNSKRTSSAGIIGAVVPKRGRATQRKFIQIDTCECN